MAKKITISELVIKIGMDTAAAVKQLKAYEKRLATAQKKTLGAEAKANTSARKRMKQAQAYLAGSREFHRLRRKSNGDALKAEKALKRAYLQNDKVKINSIKRQIGERLQEYKAQDKMNNDLARGQVRARRIIQQKEDRARKAAQRQAIKDARLKDRSDKEAERRQIRSRRMLQQMEDRSRRMAARGRREQEMADKRRVRHENHIARMQANQRKKFLNYMAGNAGGTPFTSMAGVGLGAAALTGAAMYQGTTNLADFRRSENAAKAALSTSGSVNAENPQELLDRIQRNSDYFQVNRAQGMKAFAQARAAVGANKLSDEQIMFGNQGMAAASMVTGATPEEMARANTGLMQILTSGIQGQEIKQITENLTGAAPAVFKAVEELSGKKVGGYGDIRNMSQRGELANIKGEDFFKSFTRILNEQFLKEFEKMRGTLPYEQTRAKVSIDRALTYFATGFEKPLIRILMNISSFIEKNEETFLKAGEMVGDLAEKSMEVFGILFEKIKPFLQEIYDFIMKTDSKVLADLILDIGKIVAAFMGLSFLADLAIKIVAFAKAVEFLWGIMRLGTIASFLGPWGMAALAALGVGTAAYNYMGFSPEDGMVGGNPYVAPTTAAGWNPYGIPNGASQQDNRQTTTTNNINVNVPMPQLGQTLSIMSGIGLDTGTR